MSTKITNQAALGFTYGETSKSVNSNIANTTLLGPLSVDKHSLEATYRVDNEITYILSLLNTGSSSLSNVQIVDDLGTYIIGDAIPVTPLTYVGPAVLHSDGVFVGNITPTTTTSSVTFEVGTLAPGIGSTITYKAVLNEYALLDKDSELTNTATATAAILSEDVTVDNTIKVEEYADIQIVKYMAPNPVSDGELLTYTFTVTNLGNTEATNIVLTDTFTPSPNEITVTVDGITIPDTNYTYADGTLTLPVSETYSITVPEATFAQNPTTGEVTITPSSIIIVVAGII